MKIDGDLIVEFRKAFDKDTGIGPDREKVKNSLENLVNFFYLLWQFDCEDQQKLMKMESSKDE